MLATGEVLAPGAFFFKFSQPSPVIGLTSFTQSRLHLRHIHARDRMIPFGSLPILGPGEMIAILDGRLCARSLAAHLGGDGAGCHPTKC